MKKLLPILACIFVGVLLVPAFIQPPAVDDTREKAVATQGAKLVAAFSAYRTAFGKDPDGGPAAVIRELRGENEKLTVFFECPPESLNDKGELLDPWGFPYRITFETETQKPLIHSAGKNHVFEAEDAELSDDYRSWLADK